MKQINRLTLLLLAGLCILMLTGCVGVSLQEEGLVVGEDPELDARRFERSEGGVVLITREMLAQLK